MDLSVKEISRMLAGRSESVVEMLFPQGKRLNGHWVCGDLSGSPGESLKIDLHGQHAGRWRDWASDENGDLLDLWGKSRGMTLPDALVEAKKFLGIVDAVRPAREKTYKKPKIAKPALNEGMVRRYLREQRLLTDEILDLFQIGVHIVEGELGRKGFIVFPCFSPGGALVNNSYCGLERDSETGKKKVFQDTGCAPCMFGWQALDAGAYQRRSIIICEGQIDCMTWTQWGFDCLSIPNGGGNSWIEYEWDNLAVFETIYLSYDMDGKLSSVQEAAVSRLGKHRCRMIQLPHKDANACLQAGITRLELDAAIAAAKSPKLANFASLADLRDRVMLHFFPEQNPVLIQPGTLKGPYPDKTFTVRPGEVTVWTGISFHGKSSMLAQVFIELVMLHQPCFIASLEMKPERLVKKMAQCVSPGAALERQDVSDFIDIVGELIIFCDMIGNVPEKDLLEMMHYARARYGVTQFMIDSLMKVQGVDSDFDKQGDFIGTLCKFAADNAVHIHIVAHPRKTMEDGKPSANDIKGSSLLRNHADNVIIVHRNTVKELKFQEGEITKEEFDAQWDTSVTVEKDREDGNVKSFKYKFDKSSERFIPMVIQPKTFREDPRKSKNRDQ